MLIEDKSAGRAGSICQLLDQRLNKAETMTEMQMIVFTILWNELGRWVGVYLY